MRDAERDWVEGARVWQCSKNGGKNNMKTDAKKRLLQGNPLLECRAIEAVGNTEQFVDTKSETILLEVNLASSKLVTFHVST